MTENVFELCMSQRCIKPCRHCWVIACLLIAAVMGGCAIHYFDPESGTEHVWGFGHMKMRMVEPNEGVQAVVRGTDILGLSMGRADQDAFLAAGWHRVQRLDILAQSTAVRLEWPDGDFCNVRVGTRFPFPEHLRIADQTQVAQSETWKEDAR